MTAEVLTLNINGVEVTAEAGETILSAARRVGIEIPTLCFLEGIKQIESCGLCMVEVEGQSGYSPACASRVRAGMVVRTDTPALAAARRTTLELLFSDHLGDCLAPCERACPAHIDIPGFIREIRGGRPEKALALIRESIAVVGVLGRVCPKFCERVCRRGEIDSPVPICSLKRFPADDDLGLENPLRMEAGAPSGKSVGVVGGGIVGLTAAFFLALQGHACTVYESRDRLGGALDEILPEFRMPRDVLQFEISRILDLGVRVETGKALGVDLDLAALRESHDAVLLALGASREIPPEIEGAECGSSGLDLLKRVAGGESIRTEGEVLVVGSGPTALDLSRTLLRLGADSVRIIMSPSVESSLFFKTWIPDGVAEGVEILDACEGIRLEGNAEGKTVCHFTHKGAPAQVEGDSVFLAGGVAADLALLRSLGLETGVHGVKVDRRTLQTNLPGVFAAGNIAQAGRYAIQGSAAGSHAAEAIHRHLTGQTGNPHDPVDVRLPHLSEAEKEILFAGILPTPTGEIPAEVSPPEAFDFAEVKPGFHLTEAMREAERCLKCDCAAKKDCLLRIRGTEWKANPKAYGGQRPLFERDESHPEVVHEPGKCIKCGRCVAAAEQYQEELGLTYIGRGFEVRIGVPLNHAIREGLRKAGRECAAVCPTGALSLKR